MIRAIWQEDKEKTASRDLQGKLLRINCFSTNGIIVKLFFTKVFGYLLLWGPSIILCKYEFPFLIDVIH
jgi:hypothetical protein